MLNYAWVGFFICAFLMAICQSFFIGNAQIWTLLINEIFASSKLAFEICLSLTGILCFWLGIMKIAEASGIMNLLARFLHPLFKRIMPEVPAESPAIGSIVMNMAANMLGLDNAATPMGIRAMEQLQEHNPRKDTASNAQILFMVINSSAVTLIPITILMYRAQMGSANPSAVFIPILLATSLSTFFGFLCVAFVQKINLFNKVILAYLLAFVLLIGGATLGFYRLDPTVRAEVSAEVGNFIIFALIIFFICYALLKKVKVYDAFVEGAKDGFTTAVRIIPYLVAMLVAIAVLRASGVLDYIVLGLGKFFAIIGLNTDFVPALPTAIMKPLSGSGARAMMIETMNTYGVDSFPAFVSSIIQGSTETTFYVLAVYFGAVKITKIRHALPCALLADLMGIILAITFAYLFYVKS
ncbi:MAG: nucleoside recognition domain-containing protein [Alphaproteobacteria bacterium]|nr:nucleoside recognition domain-containing protein [Alphaproteobacteria bacterium]